MHCFAVRFVLVMLALGLNTVAHGSTAKFSREEICSELQREIDECMEQEDACDKAHAIDHANEVSKKAQGSFLDELILLQKCYLDLVTNCRDYQRNIKISFNGKCRQMSFEANRHCIMSSCPGLSLVSYLEDDCVVSECYSITSRGTQLVSAATFIFISIIAFIGHSYYVNKI